MKNLEIKIGSTVTAPITDAEGEVAYVIGKLVDMNKRYAKVEVDGKVISVGKTKIELVQAEKPAKKEVVEGEEDSNRIAAKYDYQPATAASGRASVDNGDKVAASLRGKDLDFVYGYVAKTLGRSVEELKTKYGHLNPGHQRMCLGNRLRGHFKGA